MTVQVALRSVLLESRRSEEMSRLLQRHGLVPIAAPSMREVPLEDQRDAFAFGQALFAGECDLLVLLTGVGARALFGALGSRYGQDKLLGQLKKVRFACRGPKPVAVLRELGLAPAVTAPEPNTWRELLQALAPFELGGKRVWVQEYGRPNDALLAGLRERGAEVRSAAVYAWQLPLDTGPLEHAIAALCEDGADALLVTSARQVDHLLEVAARIGRRDALIAALQDRVLVCSIGPVASEGMAEHGLRPDLQPVHPKMGHLVKELATQGLRALARKRERARG